MIKLAINSTLIKSTIPLLLLLCVFYSCHENIFLRKMLIRHLEQILIMKISPLLCGNTEEKIGIDRIESYRDILGKISDIDIGGKCAVSDNSSMHICIKFLLRSIFCCIEGWWVKCAYSLCQNEVSGVVEYVSRYNRRKVILGEIFQ